MNGLSERKMNLLLKWICSNSLFRQRGINLREVEQKGNRNRFPQKSKGNLNGVLLNFGMDLKEVSSALHCTSLRVLLKTEFEIKRTIDQIQGACS